MGKNRLFVPQSALDEWVAEGRASIEGEELELKPAKERFTLRSALHFTAEEAGGGDAEKLVGRVKDLEKVAALGGEQEA